VQVDRVGGHAPRRIVLPEDEPGRLLVVRVHLPPVLFALLRQRVGRGPVAARVRLLRLGRTGRALLGFLSRQVAQSVVLSFGLLGLAVVECCNTT
jgi:hypothetical protein